MTDERRRMKLTIREFILLRIAEDVAQTSATVNAAWDDAAQMKTGYDHRTALGTLSALVEAHVPGGVAGVTCPVCGTRPWGECLQTPECPSRASYCEDCEQAWPCRTVRVLATTWRERPEYQEAWAPSVT